MNKRELETLQNARFGQNTTKRGRKSISPELKRVSLTFTMSQKTIADIKNFAIEKDIKNRSVLIEFILKDFLRKNKND